jgi:long-chain acyl-CoA synthetase
MINYLFQYLGYSVYYVESLATIADNVKEVQPHIMCSVPRFMEKIYEKIMLAGQKLPLGKRMIFNWAHHLAVHFDREKKGSILYRAQLQLADKLVYSKWREALGGNLLMIVSGGAALQMRLSSFFWAAGIKLLEGYGLTETSPVICVNRPQAGQGRFGTVGPCLEGVSVKIAEDGEILCKGPNLMLGYYKNPEMTKEVIDEDGWFHTGDLGKMEGDFLRIVGRKKEIFKTSFGKYVSPQLVENKMLESPFIDQIMVLGEHQKYVAAIVVPNFDYLKSWCAVNHVQYTTPQEIIKEPHVRKKYKSEIDHVNKTMGATEQVKSFELIDKEWTQAGGELTASLKLKRRVIEERHAGVIAKLFG